jgi:myosin protein heavy chain
MEKTMAEVVGERKGIEERLRESERHIRELEIRLEQENRSQTEMEIFRRRMTEQMEEERDQNQKDLAERDFATDQTRKKYQSKHTSLHR